jgi:hypothetical protein
VWTDWYSSSGLSLYCTTPILSFPLPSHCSVVPVHFTSFSAPNPRPPNNNTNNLTSILEIRNLQTSPHFYNLRLLSINNSRLSRRSSLVQRDRPLLYISPFVRTANPPNSPAFHLRTERTFASKIRALETPALTTSLRSLTKLQVRT